MKKSANAEKSENAEKSAPLTSLILSFSNKSYDILKDM